MASFTIQDMIDSLSQEVREKLIPFTRLNDDDYKVKLTDSSNRVSVFETMHTGVIENHKNIDSRLIEDYLLDSLKFLFSKVQENNSRYRFVEVFTEIASKEVNGLDVRLNKENPSYFIQNLPFNYDFFDKLKSISSGASFLFTNHVEPEKYYFSNKTFDEIALFKFVDILHKENASKNSSLRSFSRAYHEPVNVLSGALKTQSKERQVEMAECLFDNDIKLATRISNIITEKYLCEYTSIQAKSKHLQLFNDHLKALFLANNLGNQLSTIASNELSNQPPKSKTKKPRL